MKHIYLDYAAATPVSDEVLAAMQPYFQKAFFNPSALYLASKAVHADVEQARSRVASAIGCRPSEIIFTAGGTEANNLAIRGVMDRFPDKTALVCAIDHKSVLEPTKGYSHKLVPVLSNGQVDVKALKTMLQDDVVLVSVGYVNNEIGTIQDMHAISALLQSVRADRLARGIDVPLLFHTDACQAPNYVPVQPGRLGVDLMTINGGKIYGPKQSGCLYVRAGVVLSPQIVGGGQEFSMRSGTENVPAIVGFSVALKNAVHSAKENALTARQLQKYFMQNIARFFPDAHTQGDAKKRIVNNVHVLFPGVDNERLVMELDEQGIQCAVGSACNASSDEPSHVLTAIGLSDEEARSCVRFTLGKHTTKKDIDAVMTALKKAIGHE